MKSMLPYHIAPVKLVPHIDNHAPLMCLFEEKGSGMMPGGQVGAVRSERRQLRGNGRPPYVGKEKDVHAAATAHPRYMPHFR